MLFTTALKKNFEFRRLYRRGKCAAGPCVAVYCLKNGRGANRLGIAAGTKLGNAVKRNLVRRRIRESYRLCEHRVMPGFDIVVSARGRSVCSDFSDIDHDIKKQLSRLGLLKPEDADCSASDTRTP